MTNSLIRTELIFGKEKMMKLSNARIAVFGIGGVGGSAAEALCRSGVGMLGLFDDDKVCRTNINRQIFATEKTVGMYKVDAAKERISEINPAVAVNTYKLFYLPESSNQADLTQYDYIIDAIDTVAGKIELAVNASLHNIPVISSMGAGNKLDITRFEVADIFETSVCPLAKVIRHELRKRGAGKLKVVYSKEVPVPPDKEAAASAGICTCPGCAGRDIRRRREVPGSNAFVPPAVGLIIAGEVIKDLIYNDK